MGYVERGRKKNRSKERTVIMDFLNIPEELRILPQWVCANSNSKVPMVATSPYNASSTDSNTWSTFREAVMSVECGNYDYIGFVFNNNGIVGIDLDTAYDEEGFISPLAADIIGRCKSYTEKSRSGRGVHILVKGDLPFKGKNNLSGVEIYKQSRYFIMTGDSILYDEIIENQDAIDYVIGKYFPDLRKNEHEYISDNRIYTPKWEKPSNNKIKLRPIYPCIPDGCRNLCLTSLAGALHNQGYSRQQIYDEVCYCNKVACEPSLSDREVNNIVNSVIRYKR